MIVEREQFFSENDLKSTNYFPSYIVVRRPLNAVSEEDGEWQGFIRDLKNTIRTTAVKSKADIIQNQNLKNQELDKVWDEKINILNKKHEESSKQIDGQVKGLDSKVDRLDNKVLKIQDDMEFIKNSLTKILQNSKQQTSKF
ncbi:UNKNOWN [Stylonychia lemnae]|uniref:Uncharacterized protein n=1 Tax=Stylonychia lemnae TaxID=5949 RepID=A0A077ZYZ1_STYLE|nr:UNKNOWN [Stylonychia lemnae]|eukprot:CDW75135.1 UNKNOWN [Stylonychia lemnae]